MFYSNRMLPTGGGMFEEIYVTTCVNFLSFVCEDDFEFDTETLRLRCA